MYNYVQCTVIKDPFFDRFKFTPYKNIYHDIIDDVDKIVFFGSEVKKSQSNSLLLGSSTKCNIKGNLYDIDNHTKFSVAVNSEDKLVYAKNPHFGWHVLSNEIIKQLPKTKIDYATKHHDKEIVLNEAGGRYESQKKVLTDVNSELNLNPVEYLQSSYKDRVENSCVWLSTCLLIRSFDSELAVHLLSQYKSNPIAYEWLRIHDKGANGCLTLSSSLRNDKMCYLKVCKIRVTSNYTNNVTGYIMNEMKEGLVIAILEDDCGNKSHTVGINVSLRKIYDCMEDYILDLHVDNLSKCCGPNCVFMKFCQTGLIMPNNVNQKKA